MKKYWKKMILTAAALTALALFAGCTNASAVSLEEAKALVQETMGAQDAVVLEQKIDREDGVYELEIILDGSVYEFEVDSRTGTVREVEREHTAAVQQKPVAPAETAPAQTQSDRISGEEALTIALGHAGVSDAFDRDVEWDDGRWEVSFQSGRTEYDYDISADGTILHWEKELDN